MYKYSVFYFGTMKQAGGRQAKKVTGSQACVEVGSQQAPRQMEKAGRKKGRQEARKAGR